MGIIGSVIGPKEAKKHMGYWSPELHERFITALDKLCGSQRFLTAVAPLEHMKILMQTREGCFQATMVVEMWNALQSLGPVRRMWLRIVGHVQP